MENLGGVALKHRSFSVLLLCLLIFSSARAERRVPNLALKDVEGNKRSLAALRGSVVVLSFWATWCAPCQEELPRLSRLSVRYAGKPVTFVAVSIDQHKTREEIAAFVTAHNLHLETWTGATTETMGDFGLGNIVPGTIIIDGNGEPVTRISGEAREEDVLGPIEWLLAGRPGPAPSRLVKRY